MIAAAGAPFTSIHGFLTEDRWETAYALPCVDADSGVVADDELVVFILLHWNASWEELGLT